MRSIIDKLARKLKRYGAAATLHIAAVRSINLLVQFKILRGVYVERPDAAFLACPEKYSAEFLSADALRHFADDPRTELSQGFLREAFSRGDECFAIRDGGTLAAYGWYSGGPTPVDSDLLLHFSPRYVYMYKGFTDKGYRGQRLHALGMTMALRHYVETGFKGLVSYVESTNFDSLKSCFRMGYKVFGSFYILKIFGRYVIFASRGCEPFAFRLEAAPARRAPQLTPDARA